MSKENSEGVTWREMSENVERVRELKSKLDTLDEDSEQLEDRFKNLNSKLEKIHINIIQVVSIVVSVLALVLGNLFGVLSLPEGMNASRLTGYLFVINGITLTGITFLIILVQSYFFENNKKKKLLLLILPISLQIVGFIIINFI